MAVSITLQDLKDNVLQTGYLPLTICFRENPEIIHINIDRAFLILLFTGISQSAGRIELSANAWRRLPDSLSRGQSPQGRTALI